MVERLEVEGDRMNDRAASPESRVRGKREMKLDECAAATEGRLLKCVTNVVGRNVAYDPARTRLCMHAARRVVSTFALPSVSGASAARRVLGGGMSAMGRVVERIVMTRERIVDVAGTL